MTAVPAVLGLAVFPTGAGMSLELVKGSSMTDRCSPQARGDEPSQIPNTARTACSPQTLG